jgi:DNA-binding CsgD family transcriptional regulator
MRLAIPQRRLADDILSRIASAKSSADVVRALEHLSGELDFQCFRVVYVSQGPVAQIRSFSNQPSQWDLDLEKLPDEIARKDPVWNHLDTSTLPIVWGKDTYQQAGLVDFYEQFASYGLVSGACLSLRGAGKQMLAIGFSSDQPILTTGMRPDIFGILYLASATILEHALGVMGIDLVSDGIVPSMTSRELEVLKWSREGKTAWEIGQILSISTSTVQFHIRNCIGKLGAVNKQHAVVRALHFGLI